jgi:hypothetical protein
MNATAIYVPDIYVIYYICLKPLILSKKQGLLMKKIILPLLLITTLLMGFKLTMTDEEKVGLGRVQKLK